MSDLAMLGNMPEILAVEAVLKTLPQLEMEVTEYRANGVYVRSLKIPSGSILTGRIHLEDCVSILAQGTIKICNGKESFEITAPWTGITPAGSKNLGVAMTDCVYITTHAYSGENPFEDLTVGTFEEFEDYHQRKLNVFPSAPVVSITDSFCMDIIPNS